MPPSNGGGIIRNQSPCEVQWKRKAQGGVCVGHWAWENTD